MVSSTTHLVLIPSYNTGRKLVDTVREARARWSPVWVVIDGSNDGTAEQMRELAANDPGLRVDVLPVNRGKGAAVLHGLRESRSAGFTHALTMDADGQHPASLIETFMQASMDRSRLVGNRHPRGNADADERRNDRVVGKHGDAMILGRPIFDASAPLLRVRGRKVSNGWTQLETLGAGIGDSLYGFRVYPIEPLIRVMARQPWMRRFDFDTEAVVRLAWSGVKPINIDAPVRYLSAEEGGVSHFRYGRDNLLLSWMHLRLMLEFVLRFPWLLWRRLTHRPPFDD